MRLLKWLAVAIFGAGGLALSSVPASAAWLGLSEIRGGPAISQGELIPGTLVVPQIDSFSFSHMESAQFDFYWKTPLPNVLRWIGSPRPFVGGIVSFTRPRELAPLGLAMARPDRPDLLRRRGRR